MRDARQNEPAASLIDSALQLDRHAAAKLLTARGIRFATVVRVLDRSAPRRAIALPLPERCLQSH